MVSGTCASPPSGASRWVYDPAGNRTSQTVAGVTTSYAYDTANELCNTGTGAVPVCPNANWTYDANGNTTKTPTITSLAYNAKDQNTARVQAERSSSLPTASSPNCSKPLVPITS